MDFGGGNAGAVYNFPLEGGIQIERSSGVFEDGKRDPGRDEGAEEHVSGDACEAVQVSDTHGFIMRIKRSSRLRRS